MPAGTRLTWTSARPDRHRRAQPGRGAAGKRGQPEHRPAGPDQVEPGLGQGERGRRVGQVPHLGPGPGLSRRTPPPPGTRPAGPSIDGWPGMSAQAKCDQSPTMRTWPAASAARAAATTPGPVGRGRAAPRHPGVRLEVQPGRPSREPGRGRDLADQRGRPGGQVDVVADGVLVRRVRRAEQAQHRHGQPCLAAAPAPRPRARRRARSRRRPAPRPAAGIMPWP